MTVHTATGICQTDTAVCLLAGTRRKDRPKHVQCHSKINNFDILVHLIDFDIEIKKLQR